MMRSGTKKNRKTLGFSLIELMVVVLVIAILIAGAILQIKPILLASRADAAASYTLNQIRLARERAIDERRYMSITFTAPRTIFMQYQFTDSTGTVTYAPVTLQAGQAGAGIITLPYDMQFQTPPSPPATAPDNIGAQNNAFDFFCAGAACTGTVLYFHPDGSIVNSTDDPVQGVVYMGRPNDPLSSRAVSFFGPTGRTKAWRFLKFNTAPTSRWVQQ